MRLVFMGTPDFAVCALDALHGAGHDIAAVFTKADTPKHRGMKLLPSPVKVRALELGLPVHQPLSLKDDAAFDILCELEPEVIVVAAYGLLLPQRILALPRFGCLNIHASLLPAWRGASPINAAILHGDLDAGVTIMQMDRGLDTGDMLLKASTPVGEAETVGELHDRLSVLGGGLIVEVLGAVKAGSLTVEKQPEGFTYAPLIKPEDCLVDFSEDAQTVSRRVRGYDPFPGAYSFLGGGKVKLFGARLLENESALGAGRIIGFDKNGAVIACGQGTILVRDIQAAGGKRMACDAFFRGHAALLDALFWGNEGTPKGV